MVSHVKTPSSSVQELQEGRLHGCRSGRRRSGNSHQRQEHSLSHELVRIVSRVGIVDTGSSRGMLRVPSGLYRRGLRGLGHRHRHRAKSPQIDKERGAASENSPSGRREERLRRRGRRGLYCRHGRGTDHIESLHIQEVLQIPSLQTRSLMEFPDTALGLPQLGQLSLE